MSPFDYTLAVRRVCEDMCFRLSEFRTIDMQRVAVSFSQTRNCTSFGVYACVTPLRFAGGQRTKVVRHRTWSVQQVCDRQGLEYLYLLYIFAPRFIDLPLKQKLSTIVHELFHISPEFNGDIRRFPGRCYAHGSSRKKYDTHVALLLEKWLAHNPSPELWDFLMLNFKELKEQYGAVHGLKIPSPQLIPLD
ncbi:MAG: hypothetical protein ACRC10_12860 [Thermoguttaceae bacterium]